LPPKQRQRIVNIFAGKTNEKLVPARRDRNRDNSTSVGLFAKKRGEQFFFVNDRFKKWLFASCDNGLMMVLRDGGT
jgi:DNA mismatch repair protein MutL